jgi:hypothetical protein
MRHQICREASRTFAFLRLRKAVEHIRAMAPPLLFLFFVRLFLSCVPDHRRLALLSKVISVEPERDVVGQLRASQLVERRTVQDEQEGRPLAGI